MRAKHTRARLRNLEPEVSKNCFASNATVYEGISPVEIRRERLTACRAPMQQRAVEKQDSSNYSMATENTSATPFQTALLTLGAIAFFMSWVLEIVPPQLLLVIAVAFWGLLMLLLVLALATELYLALGARKKFAPHWRNVALFPFVAWMVAAPLAGALATFSTGVTMLYVWARAPQTSELLVLWLSVPATLLVGGAAFLFRLRLRCLYGISEVGAGLFVAWFQVRGGGSGNLLSGAFLLAFITAAVYLVVRGLDNVHQGWKAEPPDPFASFLKTRLAPRLQKEPNSSVQRENLKPS